MASSGRGHGLSPRGRDIRQSLLAKLLQQRLDLVVLERDGPLLVFVDPSTGDGKQNVPGLENEVPWQLSRGGQSPSFPSEMAELRLPVSPLNLACGWWLRCPDLESAPASFPDRLSPDRK